MAMEAKDNLGKTGREGTKAADRGEVNDSAPDNPVS